MDLEGNEIKKMRDLCKGKKAMLVVNVAAKCPLFNKHNNLKSSMNFTSNTVTKDSKLSPFLANSLDVLVLAHQRRSRATKTNREYNSQFFSLNTSTVSSRVMYSNTLQRTLT